MITGLPGDWAAWPLAATYIQWLKAFVVIGLPAISAIEAPGTPPPQPAMTATETTAPTTKKAPRARMDLLDFITRGPTGAAPALTRAGDPELAGRRPRA